MIIPPDERSVTTSYVDTPGFDERAIVPGGGFNLVDGDFGQAGTGPTIDTPWILGAGWEILLSPLAVFPAIFILRHTPGNVEVAVQEVGLLSPGFYLIKYTVNRPTNGPLAGNVKMGVGFQQGTANPNVGMFTEIVQLSLSDGVFTRAGFTPSSDFNGLITSVSLVSNHTSDPNLITDTDFTGDGVTGNPWTLTTLGSQAWSYDTTNDLIDMNGGIGSASSAITQPIVTVSGQTYFVEVTIVGQAGAENLLVSIDDTAPRTIGYITGNGTFTVPVVVGANNAAYETPATVTFAPLAESGKVVVEGGEFSGDITLVRVLEAVSGTGNILGESSLNPGFDSDTAWTKDAGWTIASGVATCDGTDGARIYQDINLGTDRDFLVRFDITAYTSGSVAAELGGTAGNSYSSVGTFMDIIKAGNDPTFKGNIAFLSTDFNGSIDNVEIHLVKSVLTGDRRVFDEVHLSAEGSGSIASGTKATMVGSGGIMQQVDVASKGLQRILTERGMYGDKGETTVWTVDKPGANVEPKLNATVR